MTIFRSKVRLFHRHIQALGTAFERSPIQSAREKHFLSCRVNLPSSFSEAESKFQRWCDVLLLDAMQRSGWFRQAEEAATAEQITQEMPGATGQLVHDLLHILKDASFLQKKEKRYVTSGSSQNSIRVKAYVSYHFLSIR